MSHIGRSLFFGRASLGWLAVLIPDRSLIIAKLVYCVPKGSGSFYVGHLWVWPFSYSLVTGVMYVRYWGTTPSIICVTVERPLKSNWPSLFVVSRSTPESWSTCAVLPIVPLYTPEFVCSLCIEGLFAGLVIVHVIRSFWLAEFLTGMLVLYCLSTCLIRITHCHRYKDISVRSLTRIIVNPGEISS